MKPLKIWDKRLQEAESEPIKPETNSGLKKSPRYYAEKTNFVDTFKSAEAMLDFIMQRPISHIGFDTEFRYDQLGVVIDKRNTSYNPKSIRPLLLSLTLAEPANEEETWLYNFVIDLRKTEIHSTLGDIFRLPLPFSGHYAKVELFCLWKLGLTEPGILWDTFIFEKLLNMGRTHHNYKIKKRADEFEQIRIKEEAKEKEKFGLSLIATCQRYGINYHMAAEKARLQQSFLTHSDNDRFSEEQIEYAAEDAIAACKLYPLQVQKAVQHGLLRHCETVEMAWVISNARIEWNGCRIDGERRDAAISMIKAHSERLKEHLAIEYGLQNAQSHKQLTEFFKDCGLLQKFKQGNKISFDRDLLKKNVGLHPAIPLLRAARRASDLLAEKLLSPEFVGDDGRIRAEHRQLGTDTGRQTSRWPNLLGLDRVLRPLIIPEDGCGIGEVDWSQVEVGVAAAIYGDDEMAKMFNSGDVYSAMAQNFFKEELSREDQTIPGKVFKAKHKKLRNQMKTCTLGIIYGITPTGLAQTLKTTESRAAALQDRFLGMFPRLQVALTQASQFGRHKRLRQYYKRLKEVPRQNRCCDPLGAELDD